MNQSKYNYIRSLGFSGALNDIVAAFYRSVGAVGGAIQDLERNMFDVMGIASGALQDRWKAYYDRVGYTGDKESAWGVAITDSKLLQEQAIGVIRRNGGTSLYVPDDYRGAYIDSAGTQPVTAVGDLVGLLTDRSYGAGNLSAQLFTAASRADIRTTVTDIGGGVFKATWADTSDPYVEFSQSVGNLRGRSFELAFDVWTDAGQGTQYEIYGLDNAFVDARASGLRNCTTTRTTQVFKVIAFSQSVSPGASLIARLDGPQTAVVGNYFYFTAPVVREIFGNHATQPTTASKPLVTRVPKRLGPNLVVNGDFSAGTTGWTALNSSLATSAGELVVTATTGGYSQGYTSFPTELGKTYLVTGNLRRGTETANAGLTAQDASGNSIAIGVDTSSTTAQPLRTTFVAATTTSRAVVFHNTGTPTGTILADNITVQEVLEWTPALKFDGSNDSLSLASVDLSNSEYAIIMALKHRNPDAANRFAIASQGASTNSIVALGATSGVWTFDQYANSVSGGVVVPDAPTVVSGVLSATGKSLYVNGALVASDANPTKPTSCTNLAIGPIYYGTSLNGDVTDVVLIKGTLTEADRKTIERNMAQRIGATYVG